MNRDDTPKAKASLRLKSRQTWDTIELSDLFLKVPPVVVRVRLVDELTIDPDVDTHDLLAALLCEV